MGKESLKYIPAKFIKTVVGGAIIASSLSLAGSYDSVHANETSFASDSYHQLCIQDQPSSRTSRIIFPQPAKVDLFPNDRFDPDQLSTGSRIALFLALLGLAIKSTTKASEFSHHAEKHEKYMAWLAVALQAAASLVVIADTWK